MRPGAWLLLALALLALAAWLLLHEEEAPRPAAPRPAEVVALAPPAASPERGVGAVAAAAAGKDVPAAPAPPLSNDLADHAHQFPAGSAPGAGELISELRRRGVRDGLAAFNPPGTKPLLIGLAVPPDFPLPPGFVRHHQTTDDGQDVEPVLRFHPDHRLHDAGGRPVPLPTDLLVPPEWAPPGLPLRRVVPPAPLPASAPRR